MAPKKRALENPPSVSSSTEEEETSSEENDAVDEEETVVVNGDGRSDVEDEEEEEEEEEDEKDDEKSSAKKSTNPQGHSPSDSEDDSASESDSDKTLPSPNVSDFTIKPILSKPMDDPKKSKTDPAKPSSASALVTPPRKLSSKRPAESESAASESKKKKVANGGDDDDGKKSSGIPRLWSEDDEVAILKGMGEYRAKTGTDPYADMGGFHEFIKKSLHVDVSKNQLMDKIRRLKKKYKNNAEKGENGEDPVFSKPHDYESFQLSKKIWGSGTNNAINESGKSKKKEEKSAKKVNMPLTLGLPSQNLGPKNQEENGEVTDKGDDKWAKFSLLREALETGNLLGLPDFGKDLLKRNMGLIGSDKIQETEEKWRKLQRKEMELFVKRQELVLEQSKLALEAMKSSMP